MPNKKILAINGSYRGEKGYTHFLLGHLFRGARSAGAQCEEVILAKNKINRCLACDKCHSPAHFLECVYSKKDDVADIFEKMKVADLFIYASPTYIFGMSGLMKVFIDRMNSTSKTHDFRVTRSGLFFHHVNSELCSKPFAVLICCDNLDAEMPRSTLAYFRAYARFMDAPLIGTLVRNGGSLAGYGEGSKNIRVQARLTKIYAAYEQAGMDLATIGHIRLSTRNLANREMIPVPLFGLLKHMLPFKRVMVERAKELLAT
jgi:multimeric flavodoxin WrbA